MGWQRRLRRRKQGRKRQGRKDHGVSRRSYFLYKRLLETLTHELLETRPQKYSDLLDELASWRHVVHRRQLRDRLNEKTYHTWWSSHLLCVALLCGPVTEQVRRDYFEDYAWYGSRLLEGIGDELAISLIDRMVYCGANIHSTQSSPGNIQYHCCEGHGIVDVFTKPSRFTRTGFERVLHHVQEKLLNL